MAKCRKCHQYSTVFQQTIMYSKSILTIVATMVVLPLCWGLYYPEKWQDLNDYQRVYIEPRYNYNWFEASDECARKDLSLIIIDNKRKSQQVSRLLKRVFGRSRNFWLDGSDLASEGTFVWSRTGDPFTFTNWAKRPDNYRGREDCVHIHANYNYKWNDGECQAKMGFICEEEPTGSYDD